MTICEIVGGEKTTAKLLPGEPDFQDISTYVRILDEIVDVRKKVLAEIRRIDETYRQNKKETPQFERDDLEALEYGSHFEIIEKYNLKVCHVGVLREFATALDYRWEGSFHLMESILAGRNRKTDNREYIAQLRKCGENGGCSAKGCEYRV